MSTVQNNQQNQFEDNIVLKALSLSPEPTAIYSDENMIIRFANIGMLRLWGKEESVIGMPLLDAIPELADQPFLAILQGVWRSGESYAVEGAPAELIHNGTRRIGFYDYEYRAICDEHGKTWCILNTAREVTSEKAYLQQVREKEKNEDLLKAEMSATLAELYVTNRDLMASMRLLSESREHVRTIIEQAPVGIAMLKGPRHIIEIANPAILHIWGRSENEVLGKPHELARPELAGQPVYNWLDQVYATGKRKTNKEFTVNLYHQGGAREAIVNSIYQPIFSSTGDVTGVLVILEEITEQVIERRKNEKDQHMLALAIDAGNLATFYYEPATNLFAGNHLLHTWFGLEPVDHIDLSKALAVIVDEDRHRVIDAIEHSLGTESDGNYAIEYQIKSTYDVTPRLIQARGRVFYDHMGSALSLNGTLRDITEQKKDEQRKDAFIGMVSHELKTPLTSLKAYLQLMQRGILGSDGYAPQNLLDKSLRQVNNMTVMINGFLDISRLDSGKMVLEKSYVDLKMLLEDLHEEVVHTIHSHQVVFDITENMVLYADREKISQVIHNLIGNAVKYSPVGSRIDLYYKRIDRHTVVISVRDEGMGIGIDDQDKIFERYYRVQNIKMGSIAGFGIGLYLCKEIVELHDGEIAVKSDGEKGATFSITLPIE
ncbi:PAS domain-containing sensor histidine kinase [Sphingobacterium griseoflavum]|uniref:histidine kinase n=1 Tax=Sphingobacterium griseoflavum TaxID=1474952 RepID=A0ABQ3HXX3_9SPHI|nr:ATP-binding protein [Sphingobacterium griseoflavum]GHE44679.1 hypothetical protein GCM10017764_29870 [Sphingobacterium griseoflavum]